MKKRTSLLLLIFKINFIFSQLNGIYTIGGTSPDYNTINNAVLALTTNGVSGPVTFNIRSGTYNEKVIIPSITGANSINRITFQSEILDSSSVKIQNNSSLAADNYVFYFDGADYITIKYLSLYRNLNSANGCRIVRIENGANHNIIENCHLKGKVTSSSSNHELVYSTNSRDTCNTLKNNIIENGWYGVFFSSLSGSNENGNVITGNNFIGTMFGINATYFSNLSINNNHLSTTYACLSLSYGNAKTSVSYNTILTASGTGINIDHCTPPTNDSLKIIGNMVTTGNGDGIGLFSNANSYLLQNSILSNATSQYAPLSCYSSTLNAHNNIIKNKALAPAIRYVSSSLFTDYNIIYTPGNVLIEYNSNTYTTLNAWSSSSFQDSHSFKANPGFISNTNLHIISDINASNNGKNLNIASDIDGDARTTTPDIGADEFDQPDNDAGIFAITNIASPICSGTTAIMVNIKNYGELSLTQTTINWSINGIIQPTYNWVGNLNYAGVSASVPIGTLTVVQNQIYNLKVWTSNPNNLNDPVTLNDTVNSGSIITKLAGNYTIGGTNPDYANIGSAISALSTRGVCSPVIFNLRTGDYSETVDLPLVNGANRINNITFQSENGDSVNTRILKSDSDFGPYRIMTSTSTAGYFNFKHLTICRTNDPMGATNNLVMLYQAHDVSFEGCIFKGGQSFSGQALHFIDCDYITVNNCSIESMAYGIKISGINSQSADSVYIIKNNILKNLASDNIKCEYVKDSLIIHNNSIYNDTINLPPAQGIGNGVTGITVIEARGKTEITLNKIIGRYYQAMGLVNIIGNAIQRANISNNFISTSCTSTNQNSAVGIFSNNYLDFIHNSIRAYHAKVNAWAAPYRTVIDFSSSTINLNLNILNNCIESDSTNYLFYDNNGFIPNSFSQFNYNNFFRKYPTYTQITNWANWPSTTNANSITFNPLYYSRDNLHIQNPQLNAGTATYIIKDIDNEVRSNIPTIGADEYNAIVTIINEENSSNNISIWPNPTSSSIKVNYKNCQTIQVEIISIEGKKVFQNTNYNCEDFIDLKKLDEGLYIIYVTTEQEKIFDKIILVK